MDWGFVEGYRDVRRDSYVRVARFLEGHETLARWATAIALALVTGLLAQVQLYTPLSPVPFTMQVFGVSLMGGLLGRRWGAASAGLYLGMGLLGFPVFAGQVVAFEGFRAFSGFLLFTTSLSAWYLPGFVAQAYIVGAVADSGASTRNAKLLGFAPLAVGGLLVFALLDVYFLSNYAALFGTETFPNVWFLLLTGGLLVIVTGSAWLALTTRARRERVELFFGNVTGLLALYAVGALGLYAVWQWQRLGPLEGSTLLAYAVLPFIPVDLAKILLAIGLLTLLRPTRAELESKASRSIPEGR